MIIDFRGIARAALSNAPSLLEELFPNGRQIGREFVIGNLRGDYGDSLKFNLELGVWSDFATGDKGGDLIDLWARVRGCTNGNAARQIAKRLGISVNNGISRSSETRYEICSEDNRIIAVHVRTDYSQSRTQTRRKRIGWETPNGSSGLDGIKTADLPLFGTQLINGWVAGGVSTIVLAEGEKAASSLLHRGIPALGTVTGAAGVPSDKSLDPLLRFESVVLWADNDPSGIKHMSRIGLSLLRLGHRNVRSIEWPEGPEKGDAADFQGGQSEIEELISAAAKFDDPKVKSNSPADLPIKVQKSGEAQGDILIADKFLTLYGDICRYLPARGWLIWDGRRWAWDERELITVLAEKTVRQLYREAAECENEQQRHQLINLARTYSKHERIRAMLAIARAHISVVHSELDCDPFILNCRNGTIDLRDGELHPHRREDLITKLTDIDYEGDRIDAPRFKQFLLEIFANRLDLIDYMQRAIGYSFTGDQREECLHFLHGAGANGKSTLIQILLQAAGDYAHTAPSELILATKFERSVPTDRADLCGTRFVAINETGDGRAIAEALLKTITGKDVIRARHLYKEGFSFSPTHHIWLSSNHKPNVTGTDLGIWRRIVLVPFDGTFTDEAADPELLPKLKNELPGILSWIVRGAVLWFQAGRLKRPEVIVAATHEYRQEQDVLAEFLAEHCEVKEGLEVSSKELYAAYRRWALEAGEKNPWTKTKFGRQLSDRGFKADRPEDHRGATVRKGLALRRSVGALRIVAHSSEAL